MEVLNDGPFARSFEFRPGEHEIKVLGRACSGNLVIPYGTCCWLSQQPHWEALVPIGPDSQAFSQPFCGLEHGTSCVPSRRLMRSDRAYDSSRQGRVGGAVRLRV